MSNFELIILLLTLMLNLSFRENNLNYFHVIIRSTFTIIKYKIQVTLIISVT